MAAFVPLSVCTQHFLFIQATRLSRAQNSARCLSGLSGGYVYLYCRVFRTELLLTFNLQSDDSPDSYEKALAALAEKIGKTEQRLALLRQRSRRYSALWTLYTTLGWIVYAIVLLGVVGWREWTWKEWLQLVPFPTVYVGRLCSLASN